MNNLKKLREGAGFRQRYIVERLQRQGSSVDEPMYSKMEANKALPCDIDRMRIAELYSIAPQEVATYPESDLRGNASKRPGDRHKPCARISHRIAPERLEDLRKAVWLCGYGTVQNWLNVCVYRVLNEAAKRKAPAGPPSDKGARKNIAPIEYHGKGGMSNE